MISDGGASRDPEAGESGRVGRGTSDPPRRGLHRAREGGGGGARGGRGGRKAHPGSGAICPRTFPGIRGGEELLPGGAPGAVTGLAGAVRKCGIRFLTGIKVPCLTQGHYGLHRTAFRRRAGRRMMIRHRLTGMEAERPGTGEGKRR